MNPRMVSFLEMIDYFWHMLLLYFGPLLLLFEAYNRGEFF